MSQRDTVIHLVAGGIAGTMGAIVTCPLEVVKTRLQSSSSSFYTPSSTTGHTVPVDLSTGTTTTPMTTMMNSSTTSVSKCGSNNSNNSTSDHNNTNQSAPQQRRLLCTGGYSRHVNVTLSHHNVTPAPTSGHSAAISAAQLHYSPPPAATITPPLSSSPLPPHSSPSSATSPNLIYCLRYIVKYEGFSALFKGLGPNLIGVAPSRAIYFCTYSQSKGFFNSILPPDSAIVHVCSASCAGFTACTATNPIWFIKTRLQLDNQVNHMSATDCIRRIYKKSGLLGFYKGIIASYVGISETVIHFVIYEAVKAWLINRRSWKVTPVGNNHTNNSISSDNDEDDHRKPSTKTSRDFLEFMAAGALSKTVASCIAYPHEVVRTRLREEGTKYSSFWQTVSVIYSEEGFKGLYRGLTTQLVRQIPNTAIMMATYECVVFILSRQLLDHHHHYHHHHHHHHHHHYHHHPDEPEDNSNTDFYSKH